MKHVRVATKRMRGDYENPKVLPVARMSLERSPRRLATGLESPDLLSTVKCGA